MFFRVVPIPYTLAHVQSSRLLEILLEINNSPQIPFDKRVDVALEPSANSKTPTLPLDRDHADRKELAMKHLEQLLAEVPHISYTAAKDKQNSYISDLAAPDGESHPANFLSADDVDDYTYKVDTAIEPDLHLPSLAPHAHPSVHQAVIPQLKNPTSVTNWLRKHAPKVFLQDGETHANAADGGDDVEGGAGGRKARGAKSERGGKGGSRGKRTSNVSKAAAAVTAAARGDWDASMDDDPDFGSTPVLKGKRKRADDQGYRPKGGSGNRPAKKKRKSEVDGTPTVRKGKKDSLSASKDASKDD